MKTKLSLLLFIYLLLTIIDNVSNETIKYKQFSIPECEDNFEYSSLNLEIIQLPKKYYGSNLKVEFEETETKTPYTFVCRLDDDKLQKALVRSKDYEDVTLSCFYIYDQYSGDTSGVELSLKSSSILGGDSIDLVKEGIESKILFELKTCEPNQILDYQYLFIKKIVLRQASHYEYSPEEQKMSFLLTAFVSQNLPANYTVQISAFFLNTGLQKNGFCILKQEIKASNDNISPVNFNCQIENFIEEEDSGFYILSTSFIQMTSTLDSVSIPEQADALISSGELKDLSVEKMPPIFTPKAIEFEDLPDGNVTVHIKGTFNEDIEGQHYFPIVTITTQQFSCFIENVKKDVEVDIPCDVLVNGGNIEDIIIVGMDIFDMDEYGKELFFLKPFSTIPFPEIYDINKFLSDISFRQVCNFETNQNLKEIIFTFVATSSDPIMKGDKLNMTVNLIKGKELEEKEAFCISQEDINPEDGKQLQTEFECKLEEIERANEYTGLEIVQSSKISGIPTDPKLLNPVKVDKLIEKGEIKNYTTEESKNEEIPVFNATSIDATNSEETGTFTINGELLSEYTLQVSFEFEIILLTGERAICTMPKIKGDEKEIKIQCILQEILVGQKIMIGQCAALDGYNEMFRMNKISTEEEVTVRNGKEIEEEKMFNTSLSFGQVNSFEVRETIIKFIFIGFVTEDLKKDESITMTINLIKGKELVEEEVM